MRCSILLTIISAVTLTIALPTKDYTQHEITKSQLQSRDYNHMYTLQTRSPAPGLGVSKQILASCTRQRERKRPKPVVIGNSSPPKQTSQASALQMTEADRLATIRRLEKGYAFKNMGLPPLRHTQSAPGLEVHGRPWSTLRSRRYPSYTTMSSARAAAYEHEGPSTPSPSGLHPKFSSGPAEMMVSYDVLQRRPGEPGYIAPSAFRASRVPERSVISIPDRKAPRQRETGSSLNGVGETEKRFSCFGCFKP